MYGYVRWNEETVIKWLAVAMCLAMVGMAVMPVVGVGDAWAAFRNFYWTKSGWAGFGADIIAGIESMKVAFLISALTGVGWYAAAFEIGFIA